MGTGERRAGVGRVLEGEWGRELGEGVRIG